MIMMSKLTLLLLASALVAATAAREISQAVQVPGSGVTLGNPAIAPDPATPANLAVPTVPVNPGDTIPLEPPAALDGAPIDAAEVAGPVTPQTTSSSWTDWVGGGVVAVSTWGNLVTKTASATCPSGYRAHGCACRANLPATSSIVLREFGVANLSSAFSAGSWITCSSTYPAKQCVCTWVNLGTTSGVQSTAAGSVTPTNTASAVTLRAYAMCQY
jgi:hypothetical protein